jgi:hypothetical protein
MNDILNIISEPKTNFIFVNDKVYYATSMRENAKY